VGAADVRPRPSVRSVTSDGRSALRGRP
jgi:hypothetical protein